MNTNDISCVQGSVVGPSTFNLYVADMPHCAEFLSIYFADDTTLILSHKDPRILIEKANSELIKIKEYFQANLLSLNVDKTVYTIFEPTVKKPLYTYLLLRYIPRVKIGNMKIGFVNEFKFLGIMIDNKMKFLTQYNNVISKIKKGLYALNSVKYILPVHTKLLIFNALIKSHYEYAAIMWYPSLKGYQIKEIVKYQKRALRYVYVRHSRSHTADLFKKSGITRFDFLFVRLTLELVHNYRTGNQPTEISKLLNHFHFQKSNNTRSSARFNFKIPPNLKKGHLFYDIMNCWNNSSQYIKKIVYDEVRPGKNFTRKIKSRIKDYINSKYEICKKRNCYSCTQTPEF